MASSSSDIASLSVLWRKNRPILSISLSIDSASARYVAYTCRRSASQRRSSSLVIRRCSARSASRPLNSTPPRPPVNANAPVKSGVTRSFAITWETIWKSWTFHLSRHTSNGQPSGCQSHLRSTHPSVAGWRWGRHSRDCPWLVVQTTGGRVELDGSGLAWGRGLVAWCGGRAGMAARNGPSRGPARGPHARREPVSGTDNRPRGAQPSGGLHVSYGTAAP
jgi:hypothetical protein